MPKAKCDHFFNVNDTINAEILTNKSFIIANERTKKNGDKGRYYTVLPSFDLFLRNRHKFPHCHEILLDHQKQSPDSSGRLVFDFDIKLVDENGDPFVIHKKIKQHVENTILRVIKKYYLDVDINLIEFIWSSCVNTEKMSKHLTVKNLYFDKWIYMSRLFYKLFCKCWDDNYKWIFSSRLVDCQIVRKSASLRMVGSKKIGGHTLEFDDDHELADSLIRIYDPAVRDQEQLITEEHLNLKKIEKYIGSIVPPKKESKTRSTSEPDSLTYDKKIYDKAFNMISKLVPGIFEVRKYSKNKIYLNRMSPGRCVLSGIKHEHENGCIFIEKKSYTPKSNLYTPKSNLYTPKSDLYTPKSDLYTPKSDLYTPKSNLYTPKSDLYTEDPIDDYCISFGCYRRCEKNLTNVYIGSLLGTKLEVKYCEQFKRRVKITNSKNTCNY